MFNTYVINLKKDIQNFYILQKKLNDINISANRFDAIYGKEISDFSKYDKYISEYSKYFSPRGLVGCGLSHYSLLDQIHKDYLKNKETEYTLILEDDVTPLIKDKKDIEDIIISIPKDCDILLLHYMCIGRNCITNDDEFKRIIKPSITGSAASYLVKNSSIPKLLNKKIYFHIDIVWYNSILINSYLYHKILFNPDNTHSYNSNNSFINAMKFLDIVKFNNMTLNNVLNFKIFRIPLLNAELSIFEIIILIIVLLILFNMMKKLKKNNKTNKKKDFKYYKT